MGHRRPRPCRGGGRGVGSRGHAAQRRRLNGGATPKGVVMTARSLRLGVLEGDDIGHEIVPAAVRSAEAAPAETGLAIQWTSLPIGPPPLHTTCPTLPQGPPTTPPTPAERPAWP